MSSRIRVDAEGGGPGDAPPPPAIEEPPPPPPSEPPASEPPPSDPPPDDGADDGAGEAAAGTQEERDKERRRIDRLTREKYEAQRQRDEYAAMLRQIHQQQQQPNLPPEQRQAVETAKQELREEQMTQAFNQACNDLFRKGQQEFGDMRDAVEALNAVGYGSRGDVLAALTQLPDGHRIYRELATDLDRAARLLTLPPMTVALELARMSGRDPSPSAAAALRDPEPATRAPAPLRPVGGNSMRGEKPLDQVSMAEFIRRRDRDERGSRIRR